MKICIKALIVTFGAALLELMAAGQEVGARMGIHCPWLAAAATFPARRTLPAVRTQTPQPWFEHLKRQLRIFVSFFCLFVLFFRHVQLSCLTQPKVRLLPLTTQNSKRRRKEQRRTENLAPLSWGGGAFVSSPRHLPHLLQPTDLHTLTRFSLDQRELWARCSFASLCCNSVIEWNRDFAFELWVWEFGFVLASFVVCGRFACSLVCLIRFPSALRVFPITTSTLGCTEISDGDRPRSNQQRMISFSGFDFLPPPRLSLFLCLCSRQNMGFFWLCTYCKEFQ